MPRREFADVIERTQRMTPILWLILTISVINGVALVAGLVALGRNR